MTRSRLSLLCFTALLSAGSGGALRAFSLGAPICEVNALPLIEMSPTLASPAPSGWTLDLRPFYYPGQAQTIRVRNSDPLKRVRGVLIWAKAGQFTGAGSFAVPAGGLYQTIPAPAVCGEWAISHNSPTPKTQAELQFEWTAPASGTPIVRAFIIEECGLPSGDCRPYQALTPVRALVEALFVDGMEEVQ